MAATPHESLVSCQLCGVKFDIARLRCAGEPPEAAWDRTGSDFVDITGRVTGCERWAEATGCMNKIHFEGPAIKTEHLAGPGCCCTYGYSGHRISALEMSGCQHVQAVVRKGYSWQPEPEDRDFELNSNHCLSAIAHGSPMDSYIGFFEQDRHGIVDLLLTGISSHPDDEYESGIPFHPTCFEIFERVSRLRLGRVDLDGLCTWRQIDRASNLFDVQFPRHPAVINGRNKDVGRFHHEPGTEFLAANPVDVPGLAGLLGRYVRVSPDEDPKGPRDKVDIPSLVDRLARYIGKGTDRNALLKALLNQTDPFVKLPPEINHMMLRYCSFEDITCLMVASPAFRSVPPKTLRRAFLEDMPWLWEIEKKDASLVDWVSIHRRVNYCWLGLKGLQNRKRIWGDCEEIVRRIARYRREGRVPTTYPR